MKLSNAKRWHAGLLTAAALFTVVPAQAHPHVWVIVRDTVVFENGQISGLQQDWTFDEMYTAMAIEGLDTNKDGKYDRKELQELAQTNIDGLKDFNNFTYANVAGMTVPFGKPRDYWLEYEKGILTLHFFLPFLQPLPSSIPHLKVTVTDQSFFIAFEFAKDDPVKLSKGAPAQCRAGLAKDDETKDQKDLNNAFGNQFLPFGSGAGAAIEVSCSK